MAEETQDGQKTLVAFVVGLLIGGMLVWAFSGPTASAPESQNENNGDKKTEVTDESISTENQSSDVKREESSEKLAPALKVGQGEVAVADQPASASIKLENATYPIGEGWIGVREYTNENLGSILGVVRFSESQGLVPSEIILQRPTSAGNHYAVVIFTEDGDFEFNLAGDVQIDKIFDTFVAQ